MFYKKFDITKHKELKHSYWAENKKDPSVDIFLPVCGERVNILQDTFSCVKRIDYKNKHVYVLDDKGEDDVKKLAQKFGFSYLSRPNKGEMKKAGNLLYGFKHGTSEFYAVFDADFCPHPDFIVDLLPYMRDSKVGIVQSPHFFEIGDHIHKKSPIEYGSANLQEQFFRTIQVARDRFGGAICAGSNTIYRRTALEKNGGPAQVDHGEDVNTGIDIINLGYSIKYVPVILAKGLSPDTLQAFYKQQNRWASSSAGLLLSGKIFKSKLTFVQRLCYLSGITYYFSQFAYFLLPAQLFVMMGNHSSDINLTYSLPFIPYIFFSMVLLPMFSRKSKPKFGTYVAIISSVYVHCYTILLRLLGKPANWIPTNAISSNLEKGFIFLNEFSLLFLSVYFIGISYLFYSWNLPILNVAYLSLLFWIIWHIAMHFIYFFQTHAAIYHQRAIDLKSGLISERQFNFWNTRTTAAIVMIVSILSGSMIYSIAITDQKVLFATRKEILIENQLSSSTANLIMTNPTPTKPQTPELLEQDKTYSQVARPGDSYTRMYRRIINEFTYDNGIAMTPTERLFMEDYLVKTLPQTRLKPFDIIDVSEATLLSAMQTSMNHPAPSLVTSDTIVTNEVL